MVAHHHVAAEVRFGTLAQGAAGLSDECIGMLNQAVNCDRSLLWANDANSFYTDATLTALCTETCNDSLSSYASRIHSACGASRYNGGDGLSYLAAYKAELALEKFRMICLTNDAGQRCNLVLGQLAGIDPSNQLSTATAAPNLMCNACAISLIKTQLEMPLVSNADVASGFASITASCKTSVSITPPGTATQWVVSATTTAGIGNTATTTSAAASSTAAAGCQGETYTIQAGDTCTSVSLSQRISTVQLLAANNLKADCSSFPTSGTVCIPSAAKCEAHRVSYDSPSESCNDLAVAANATVLQIVAWNPELGTNCVNLARQAEGYTVCLSPPGGSWVDPYPSSATSATTTSTE
ncbi:carbohydrate-binding module family 50 protein [Parathielavia hyrcaniae]|uniref:Carbohydrate-binding module family 50 protein n=1 Tax=Parathielavia hyrcaniae TaxID=113614 RepID=A0AAN6PTF5_9PEZI|nr:carbohydrate-binding module family 50 protein [Parathielavia hyrcaniae]